ncbi:MAG TPA: hypothetical protein VHC21_03485 [Candidatus Saccharimonadales bacterium]|nr:hypothetical protein [Candidatus Saccharimonadales bacterium]
MDSRQHPHPRTRDLHDITARSTHLRPVAASRPPAGGGCNLITLHSSTMLLGSKNIEN